MLSLVIAEAALEAVPPEIASHPSVAARAAREGRDPRHELLDKSWHFAAMAGLEGAARRGRPDLVHFALLEATGTPLYAAGMLRVVAHTVAGVSIEVGAGVRLPRSYHRFAGLAGKLLREGRVDAGGRRLLGARREGLARLVGRLRPARVVGLSSRGRPAGCAGAASRLGPDACLVVGGFQSGGFSPPTAALLGETLSICGRPLEAHVAIARVLYEYEKTVFM